MDRHRPHGCAPASYCSCNSVYRTLTPIRFLLQAYTIGCAGGDGFLKILPVYVDHILVRIPSLAVYPSLDSATLTPCPPPPSLGLLQYPTLTKEGFTTEVHHVDGKGENAGVVYAEMQARENGSSDLMALKCVLPTSTSSSRARFQQADISVGL